MSRLSPYFPYLLAGPFTDAQHDVARGFRLLAHAEIEAYLEDRARAVVLGSKKRFDGSGKPTPVVWSLLAFKLVQPELPEERFKSHYSASPNHIGDSINKAVNAYMYALLHNHGIRENNIFKLLFPIGFAASDIDPTWLSTIDSFGSRRGETAHQSYKTTQLVDPATEQKTVEQILLGLLDIDAIFSGLR